MRRVKTVLLIDDERDWKDDLERELGEGYAVSLVAGEDCTTLLERERFDFVVIDLKMPKVNGKKAYRLARQQNRLCGFAVWTLLDTGEVYDWFQERGIPIYSKRVLGAGLKQLGRRVRDAAIKDPADLVAVVIEDKPQHQAEYAKTLQRHGIRTIRTAMTIDQGQQILAGSKKPDIILLDTFFPVGSTPKEKPQGASFARKLLKDHHFKEHQFLILFTTQDPSTISGFKSKTNFIPISVRNRNLFAKLDEAIGNAVLTGPFCEYR